MLDHTRAEPAQGHFFLPERKDLAGLMAEIDRVNGRLREAVGRLRR